MGMTQERWQTLARELGLEEQIHVPTDDEWHGYPLLYCYDNDPDEFWMDWFEGHEFQIWYKGQEYFITSSSSTHRDVVYKGFQLELWKLPICAEADDRESLLDAFVVDGRPMREFWREIWIKHMW